MITTDDCANYKDVLLAQYGELVVPPRSGRAGRPPVPFKQWPVGAAYATVNKTYAKGRVAEIRRSLVFGTPLELAAALEGSRTSSTINTSIVERQNATDRNYNDRKARKTYEFSKDLLVHVAVSWWVMLCYNFHHTHRSLRLEMPDGTFEHRTPAMAIGIASKPLSREDILLTQVVGTASVATPTLASFRNRSRGGGAP